MAVGFKTGGRKPGSPNKVTADVRAIAQKYAPDALKELARLSVDAESEQARVAAIKEILERAYGKSRQSLDIDADVRTTISRIELVPVGA